jgi:hypothetical protein
MTESARIRLKREAAAILERLRACRAAAAEASASGAKTAAVATAGSSQSYTRMSLDEIAAEIARLERAYRSKMRRLSRSGGSFIRRLLPDLDI